LFVRGSCIFERLDTGGELLRLGREGRGILSGVLKRGGEGEIHGAVAEAERVLRILLLGMGDGKRSELLRRIERMRVDEARLARGEAFGAEPLAVVRPTAREDDGRERDEQENEQSCERDVLAEFHVIRLQDDCKRAEGNRANSK